MNAEQIKENVPLTLPHWGLETVKISAQLLCTDLPGKIIFLGWCGILSWRICSYRNFIASGWGTAKFTASHFSYRSTSCEAGNTGNAVKSQFPLGTWLAAFVSIFLTARHRFLHSQVQSWGLTRGSTAAVRNGATGPLRVSLVSGACQQSELPLLEMASGPGKMLGTGLTSALHTASSPSLVTGSEDVWHGIAEIGKFTFLPCIKSSFPQYCHSHTFPLYTAIHFRWRRFRTLLKTMFAFKDTVGKFTWRYHNNYMRQTVPNRPFGVQSTVPPVTMLRNWKRPC